MSSPRAPLLPGGRVRVILAGVAALVGAAVLVGLLLSWLGTQAIEAAGLAAGGETGDSLAADTSTGPTSQGPTDPESTTPAPTTEPTTPPGSGRLVASPQTAAAFEQVSLTGRLPGAAAGTTLQVERREAGGWVEFPVTVTTGAGGTFATIVELGQSGPNVLRLGLPGSTRYTPSTTVTVR